jgi:hypothetical protein
MGRNAKLRRVDHAKYFRDLKELSGGTKFDKKIADIDGAISTYSLQLEVLANFPMGHNAKLRRVDHAK